MLKNKKINIKVSTKHLKLFNDLGYDCKLFDTIEIDIKHLPKGSNLNVDVVCTKCGKEKSIRFSDYNKIIKSGDYYCGECSKFKVKKNNLEKYGVENIFQLDKTKEKIKKTNLDKYGVEYPTQSDEIKNKSKKTNLKKYGKEHHLQNKKILKKQHKTNKEKYGVKYSFLNDMVKEKIKDTNILKYGFDNPMKNDNIKQKSFDSKLQNTITKYNKDFNIIGVEDDLYKIECDNGCQHNFLIDPNDFRNRIKYKTIVCTTCHPINDIKSGQEIELLEYIKSVYDGKIVENYRNGKEIDVYIPDMNIGFEYNGLYYHSELFKHRKYHLEKNTYFQNKNIRILHIFSDDWLYKNDIIKSRINYIFNKSERIFARKCEIKEIDDNKLIRNFLENNHTQGFVGSNIKLGLFYNNELVSLMTFGKLRKNMGSKNKKNSYELLRFCNKLNTTIVGGANKLFNYFIKNYKYDNIISYSDRSFNVGGLYEKLGFVKISTSDVNYHYIIDGFRKNRFNYRKDVLVKQGYDKNKSEHEIMLERKIYRIYDCGSDKFLFSKNNI